jgi:hypothetical protein
MSTEYYLACRDCQRKIHIAQDGMSGFTFYSGEPKCMHLLRDWLEHHTAMAVHRLEFVSENDQDAIDWQELPWQ